MNKKLFKEFILHHQVSIDDNIICSSIACVNCGAVQICMKLREYNHEPHTLNDEDKQYIIENYPEYLI